jgi:hypothetical protein
MMLVVFFNDNASLMISAIVTKCICYYTLHRIRSGKLQQVSTVQFYPSSTYFIQLVLILNCKLISDEKIKIILPVMPTRISKYYHSVVFFNDLDLEPAYGFKTLWLCMKILLTIFTYWQKNIFRISNFPVTKVPAGNPDISGIDEGFFSICSRIMELTGSYNRWRKNVHGTTPGIPELNKMQWSFN